MRLEDTAFESWQHAQESQTAEWPEPQTSEFYHTLRRGAARIIGGILGESRPDLALTAATTALMKAHTFRGHSLFSTWFYRLCRNVATIDIRYRAIHKEDQLDAATEPGALSQVSLLGILLAKGLTPMEFELAELLQQGYSISEIGERMRLTRGGVNYRCSRLRKKLKSLLTT